MRETFSERVLCADQCPTATMTSHCRPGLSPDRDAVVGALMPASMIAPVECPSLSPAPPSDTSATASPVNGEDCVPAGDLDDSLSLSPWQEKRSEVESARGSLAAVWCVGGDGSFRH